MAREEKAIKKA